MNFKFKISQSTMFKVIVFFVLFLIVCFDIFDGSTESQKLLGSKGTRIITAKEQATAVNKGKKDQF